MNHTFEWGVVIATFLCILTIVPCHCARLTYSLNPKLRGINGVLITPQLITLTLQRLQHLRRAASAPKGLCLTVSHRIVKRLDVQCAQ